MNKVVQGAVVAGYGSGESDFSTALSALPPEERGPYDLLISVLTAAVARPDASCVLSVAGHSDRVDGVGHIAALAQELQASQDRADSALDYVVAEIRSAVAGLPEDLDELSNVAVAVRYSGASLLAVSGDALDEQQRRMNRRVQIRAIAFVP